jgi:hypothetical protein
MVLSARVAGPAAWFLPGCALGAAIYSLKVGTLAHSQLSWTTCARSNYGEAIRRIVDQLRGAATETIMDFLALTLFVAGLSLLFETHMGYSVGALFLHTSSARESLGPFSITSNHPPARRSCTVQVEGGAPIAVDKAPLHS